MSENDWNPIGGGTATGGATTGLPRPLGGGSFTFAMKASAPGAAGVYANQANYAPMAKGCKVTGAVVRMTAGASSFLFCSAGPNAGDLDGGDGINARGYLLGVGVDGKITLAKGPIAAGLAGAGVIARGTAASALGAWVHLRLDVIVNPNRDVILHPFQSDLGTNPVTAPVWGPVAGLAPQVIDDWVGLATGSIGLTGGGHAGFAFAFTAAGSIGAADQVTIDRQL